MLPTEKNKSVPFSALFCFSDGRRGATAEDAEVAEGVKKKKWKEKKRHQAPGLPVLFLTFNRRRRPPWWWRRAWSVRPRQAWGGREGG